MIKFKQFQRDKQIGLAVTGHANYAPKGFDIVCASISAIVQTAAIGCKHFDPKTTISAKDGDFLFACKATGKTRPIIKAAMMGLEQVKEQYPECFTDK